MASEDSRRFHHFDDLIIGPSALSASVHRTSKLENLYETIQRQVSSCEDKFRNALEDLQVGGFGPPESESFEEREHIRAQVLWLGDFKVEDTVRSAPDAPHREHFTEECGHLSPNLRYVERQTDPERHQPITFTDDRNVEAPFALDESRHIMTQWHWDSVQPR